MADHDLRPRPPSVAPSAVEGIKLKSRFLRGTLETSLADGLTGALSPDDAQLCKFHGFYQQDDRDQRAERQAKKLEPLYSFMLRVCIPGGALSSQQWLVLDELAQRYGSGSLRITTRQSVQIHGVIKRDIKPTIRAIHEAMLSTLAACGDVNRNVMGAPLADSPKLSAALLGMVRELSRALAPRTRAYHEIWLDGEKLVDASGAEQEEPLYGPTYLPRKFKCGIVIPPDNDVDVYTQDLGLIAIAEGDELLGFNVLAGGGMGRAHGDESTYPRLGSMLGFCKVEHCLDVARAVLATQRDLGNRGERHHARLKYTIDRIGLDVFRAEVEGRVGRAFEPARPFTLTSTLDRHGWFQRSGQEHLQLCLPSGRVRDSESQKLRSAIRELASVHEGELRLTGNQNLMLVNVAAHSKQRILELVEQYGLLSRQSALRRSSLSCVALPTCGLAMAEAERYLPQFLARLEDQLAALGLGDEPIVLRMTGCPNGCARPYNAEVALVGRAPGLYDLYLGGNRSGTRLASLAATNLNEEGILQRLTPLFNRYAVERCPEEGFGDFCVREQLLPQRNAESR